MRILVCGGLDFCDQALLARSLERLLRDGTFSLLIHGNASGADRLASQWAHDRGIDQVSYPANWVAHGRAAGQAADREHHNAGIKRFYSPNQAAAGQTQHAGIQPVAAHHGHTRMDGGRA